jgi:hypothetical protein
MASAPKQEKHTPQVTPIASAVLDDGTIVETVYQRDHGRTTFVVGRGDEWIYENKVATKSGETLVPLSAQNNLLKHGVLLLPQRPQEYGDQAALVADIVTYLRRYVDLSAAAEQIVTHFILLTWVYDAFNELPYLRFRGEYGSGKTRALLTAGGLCYKAFFASGASTVSPIFHILDSFGGTLVLDEADFRFSDAKADLVKILNNGNVKGLPVLRTMPSPNGKEWSPKAFQVFGPKIVASRGAFEDRALESRFLTEEMGLRSVRGEIPLNLPDIQKSEAEALRNKLLLYRLRTRRLAAIDETSIDPSLEPRFNQILAPLLSVVADRSVRHEIQLFARGAQNDLISEREQSIEGRVVELLAEAIADAQGPSHAIGTLVARFKGKYGAEFDRTMNGRWMGSILRRKLGLPTYRHAGSFYVSLRDAGRLQAIFRRYGLADDAAAASRL